MRHIDDIVAYLNAYSTQEVKAAIERWGKASRAQQAGEWKPWVDDHAPSPPLEWSKLPNGEIQYREPVALAAPERAAKTRAAGATRKTSLAAAAGPTELKCPRCAETMFKKQLCPSCTDGQKGYRVRLTCGDCLYEVLL